MRKSVGEKIAEARKAKGWTQTKLSIKAKVPQVVISLAENNKMHPHVKEAIPKLLAALNTDGLDASGPTLSVPIGAKRCELVSCPACEGSGQTWKFFS